MNENTRDLSEFGYRELAIAGDLLKAYTDPKNDKTHFIGGGVAIEFNPNSGNVFIVDVEYNVAMLEGENLVDFFSSPYEGKEGSFDELKEEYAYMHHEDKEWFEDIAKEIDEELPELAE